MMIMKTKTMNIFENKLLTWILKLLGVARRSKKLVDASFLR